MSDSQVPSHHLHVVSVFDTTLPARFVQLLPDPLPDPTRPLRKRLSLYEKPRTQIRIISTEQSSALAVALLAGEILLQRLTLDVGTAPHARTELVYVTHRRTLTHSRRFKHIGN